jgi:hypothetical protein
MQESNADIIILSILMILFAISVGGMGSRVEEKKSVSIEKDSIFNKWRRIY